jgi:hypothetical protein
MSVLGLICDSECSENKKCAIKSKEPGSEKQE